MAATDQKIAQIQREMEQAQHELRRVQAAMEKQRAEITAANRRELEELARQTGERLRERDKQVQKQYEAMLEKSVSAQETRLEQEFRSYQAKYEQLAVQLRGALAQEQQKTEEALLAQKQFEQAYFARRDFSRQRAEEVCTRTFTQVREALRTEPLEWCSTGCSERFRTALANMEQWMKEGFYESVIAIGENLQLTISLEVLQAQAHCRRWFHYYQTLHGALAAEETLLFETAVQVPEELAVFEKAEKIIDHRMQPEQLAFWSDGSYEARLNGYSSRRTELSQFQPDGRTFATLEEAKTFMVAHPELSANYSEMQLYGTAMKTAQRMEQTEQEIRLMQSRMRCYDERRRLLKSMTQALKSAGYAPVWRQFFHDRASSLGACYQDSMNIFALELYIIPVLRRTDSQWVNTVCCALPPDAEEQILDEVRHLLAEALAPYGIGMDYAVLRGEQEPAERVRLLTSDSRLRINGRLN
ncbi:MAG: hypothetical protein E7502_01815 [Ruminococcus sp.]|nr:hypothetical protein [Ruminococcus sp.]